MRPAQKVEVCKEYLRARCDFANCRYAHPDEHVMQIPGDVMVCTDAVKSLKECPRKEICKYYHGFEGQKLLPNGPRMLAVCREFFRSDSCKRGLSCQFAHPPPNVAMPTYVDLCLNFVIGKCTREDCKYYHDVDSRVDHGICRDYPACPRGDSCQFSHPVSAARPSMLFGKRFQEASMPERMTDASKNCLNFFYGNCTRGDSCKYSHIECATMPAPLAMTIPNEFREVKKRRIEPYEPMKMTLAPMPLADPSQECLDFFHGRCMRGSECRFQHVTQCGGLTVNVSDVVMDPNRECLQFFYGQCTRGHECKYEHTTVKECKADGEVNTRKNGDYGQEWCAPMAYESYYQGPPHTERRDSRASHVVMQPFHPDRTEPAEPCKEFALGKCGRDTCKYLHDPTALCPDFKRGNCLRGSACLFSHQEPCRDFMHGSCTRGDSCRFQHSAPS